MLLLWLQGNYPSILIVCTLLPCLVPTSGNSTPDAPTQATERRGANSKFHNSSQNAHTHTHTRAHAHAHAHAHTHTHTHTHTHFLPPFLPPFLHPHRCWCWPPPENWPSRWKVWWPCMVRCAASRVPVCMEGLLEVHRSGLSQMVSRGGGGCLHMCVAVVGVLRRQYIHMSACVCVRYVLFMHDGGQK